MAKTEVASSATQASKRSFFADVMHPERSGSTQ